MEKRERERKPKSREVNVLCKPPGPKYWSPQKQMKI